LYCVTISLCCPVVEVVLSQVCSWVGSLAASVEVELHVSESPEQVPAAAGGHSGHGAAARLLALSGELGRLPLRLPAVAEGALGCALCAAVLLFLDGSIEGFEVEAGGLGVRQALDTTALLSGSRLDQTCLEGLGKSVQSCIAGGQQGGIYRGGQFPFVTVCSGGGCAVLQLFMNFLGVFFHGRISITSFSAICGTIYSLEGVVEGARRALLLVLHQLAPRHNPLGQSVLGLGFVELLGLSHQIDETLVSGSS